MSTTWTMSSYSISSSSNQIASTWVIENRSTFICANRVLKSHYFSRECLSNEFILYKLEPEMQMAQPIPGRASRHLLYHSSTFPKWPKPLQKRRFSLSQFCAFLTKLQALQIFLLYYVSSTVIIKQAKRS